MRTVAVEWKRTRLSAARTKVVKVVLFTEAISWETKEGFDEVVSHLQTKLGFQEAGVAIEVVVQHIGGGGAAAANARGLFQRRLPTLASQMLRLPSTCSAG